jgi:hypothetical protein
VNRCNAVGAAALRLAIFFSFALPCAAYEHVQVPALAYIGDSVQLLLNLGEGQLSPDTQPRLVPNAEDPSGGDVEILSMQLHKTLTGYTLIIDCAAFAIGRVPLPLIELGELKFEGLSLMVASVLAAEGGEALLSPPASIRNPPGTALVLLGFLFCVGLALFLALGIGRGGRSRWARFIAERKKRRDLRKLIRALEQLRATPNEQALDILALRLRSYVALVKGVACQSWIPREFLSLGTSLFSIFSLLDDCRYAHKMDGAALLPDMVHSWIQETQEAEQQLRTRPDSADSSPALQSTQKEAGDEL